MNSMILKRRSGKQEFSIDSIEDLYQLEFIKMHAENPKFCHFSYEDNSLIAIYRDGFEWWVIGNCTDIKSLGLPKFDKGKYLVDFNGTTEIVNGTNHYCSVADTITLKDGRVGRLIRETNI